MSAEPLDIQSEHQVLRLGNIAITFIPHVLPGPMPRIFVVVDDAPQHAAINLSPDDARRFAERLKIAACQAEGKARRKKVCA